MLVLLLPSRGGCSHHCRRVVMDMMVAALATIDKQFLFVLVADLALRVHLSGGRGAAGPRRACYIIFTYRCRICGLFQVDSGHGNNGKGCA